MKKYRILSRVFAALAILLSDVMCAVTAFSYCDLWWGGRCAGYSAPASTALLLCIPYGAGILICAGLAWFFWRAGKRQEDCTPGSSAVS